MKRFDFDGRWAFHALHDDGRCYGMSKAELFRIYRSADVILNLYGGTAIQPEHEKTGCLVYLDTDPVRLQIELSEDVKETRDFLAPHNVLFTFAENYGRPDCGLPATNVAFHTTRQPVVLDFWAGASELRRVFTTVGNWRQDWRTVRLEGRELTWSKHLQFAKYLDMPARAGESFELALANCPQADREILSAHGWDVVSAASISSDADTYREYLRGSLAEFTVAKEQNISLRSGWFSDRSACYLASGRPVVTQDTGFEAVIPTGEGLFAFSSFEEALNAVEEVTADPLRHSERCSGNSECR
jgi:hypothetical protein